MEKQLTNDEIAKVFGRYLMCEVTAVNPSLEQESKGYLTGITGLNDFEAEIQFHDGLHAEEDPCYVDVAKTKLSLFLLSKIKDADLIEVAKLMYGEDIRTNKSILYFLKSQVGSYADKDYEVYEYLKLKRYDVRFVDCKRKSKLSLRGTIISVIKAQIKHTQ